MTYAQRHPRKTQAIMMTVFVGLSMFTSFSFLYPAIMLPVDIILAGISVIGLMGFMIFVVMPHEREREKRD